MQKLREQKHVVDIVSKCHSAVQNFGSGCETADHWVNKYVRNGQPKCKYLFVEELSQINVTLWCHLSLVKAKGVTMVLLGDFRQFSAIMDSWVGTPLKEDQLMNSQLLWDLADGNWLQLSENRRSDPCLFNFYSGLDVRCEDVPLEAARAQFPVRNRRVSTHLVIPHRERMRINAAMNCHDKPLDSVFIAAPKQHSARNVSQDMWLWRGLRLIGAGGPCLKGCFYYVADVSESGVELTDGQKLSPEQAIRWLRLSYAITYASCQGLTLKGVVRLHTRNPHFTCRHLYVGSSRATAADLLEID